MGKGQRSNRAPEVDNGRLEKRAEVNTAGNTRVEKEVARMQKKIATNETQQQRLLIYSAMVGLTKMPFWISSAT